MTYEEFRKTYPATRGFQAYTIGQRIERWSTPLRSSRFRNAIGEHFYTHPLKPGCGYPTAKAATMAAFEVYMATLRRIAPVPVRVVVDDDAATLEAAAVEEATPQPCRKAAP